MHLRLPAAPRAIAVLPILALCGCGASTVRVQASPTLDTTGRVGFEALFSAGIGWPLDFAARSHHFVQLRSTLGGGMDTQTGKALFIGGADADYIYWGEGAVDLRVGLQGQYRKLPELRDSNEGGSFGGHVGLMPIVLQDSSGWIVSQLAIGPEARIEYVSIGMPNGNRAQFSVPLIVEANLLVTGD